MKNKQDMYRFIKFKDVSLPRLGEYDVTDEDPIGTLFGDKN